MSGGMRGAPTLHVLRMCISAMTQRSMMFCAGSQVCSATSRASMPWCHSGLWRVAQEHGVETSLNSGNNNLAARHRHRRPARCIADVKTFSRSCVRFKIPHDGALRAKGGFVALVLTSRGGSTGNSSTLAGVFGLVALRCLATLRALSPYEDCGYVKGWYREPERIQARAFRRAIQADNGATPLWPKNLHARTHTYTAHTHIHIHTHPDSTQHNTHTQTRTHTHTRGECRTHTHTHTHTPARTHTPIHTHARAHGARELTRARHPCAKRPTAIHVANAWHHSSPARPRSTPARRLGYMRTRMDDRTAQTR